MVTLVGASGVGKTRLAVQAAASMMEDCPDGVWFVEFPMLPDPSLVVPALAAVLKVTEDPSSSLLDSIIVSLVAKRTLLVLDNSEEVRRPCAAMIEAIFK